MADKRGSRRRKAARPGSLLSPESTGGITAGGGFDFQLRYVACHLPIWLKRNAFRQLFFEGTGDVDIRFSGESASLREHIQIKDHDVSPGELKKAITQFKKIDQSMPGVYQSFTIACPSLSSAGRPVETALARLRGAKPFYDDVPGALSATEAEFVERLMKVGLDDQVEFIRSKVHISIGHGDLCNDESALDLFIARLLALPEFADMVRAMVEPVFAEVTRVVGARRGIVMEREEIETILKVAVRALGAELGGITVWVQNWTNESFDRVADYILDWSRHFDRSTRRVPSMEVWNNELLPELRALQKRIIAERKERLIHFRGKCSLSTGIAVGATFPAVGGWTFEVPQPPSPDHWRSDHTATSPYEVQLEIVEGDPASTEIILGLNIKADGRHDLMQYAKGVGIHPALFAFVAPPVQGPQAIRGAEDASAFAIAVRTLLGYRLKKHNIKRVHVFFYGPLALSLFLGQQFTSVGEIQCYEYQDPGYVPSCTFRT